MSLQGCNIFRYDPEDSLPAIQSPEISVSRFLMKRLHLVEKVKDANTLGILIGTLGVDGYLEAVDRIKLLAKRAGKKTYIIAVGRPNVPKLANFPEVGTDLALIISPQFLIKVIFEVGCQKFKNISSVLSHNSEICVSKSNIL